MLVCKGLLETSRGIILVWNIMLENFSYTLRVA